MSSTAELFAAIKAGDADRIRAMLAANQRLAGARDENGVSAVAISLYHQKKDIARCLVDAGAPLDLFESAMLGDLARVQQVVEKDASTVRAMSPDGGTALHFACFFGHPDVVAYLLERGAVVGAVASAFGNVQPLHSAVASRVLRSVDLLLQNGADANARQQAGWTALHSAGQHGDTKLAKLLLQFGANPLAKSDDGQTPIDMAQKAGHRELAAMLRANAE